ncbi:hypothetical protein RB601_009049 [Gaeumannomyces tritici]
MSQRPVHRRRADRTTSASRALSAHTHNINMSSLRRTVHESLPYVDPDPTPAQRAAAQALIDTELDASPAVGDHPDLPTAYAPRFTPALEAELARVAGSADPTKPTPLRAIDTKRYEAQDDDDDDDGQTQPKDPAALEASLGRAHTLHAYLRLRREHLALLDAPEGRNAWLVGNWQLEAELRTVEAELAAARRSVDAAALRRRRAQDGAAPELRGLDESWRKGVGQAIEVEVAAVALRAELDAAAAARFQQEQAV